MRSEKSMTNRPPSRRDFLRFAAAAGGLGAACSFAASPLRTPVAFTATPGENRLVVIVLRGAMDGLDVLAPYGDPDYAALRPTLAKAPGAGAVDLDGFFALHDELADLLPLWRAGEFAAVHAVSTPYRDARSHFDGQDVLESGAADDRELRDGWLNRALGVIPGAPSQAEVRYAMSVGRSNMLLLEGDEPAGSWAPSTKLQLDSEERGLLERLYARDPDFHAVAAEAFQIGAETEGATGRETGAVLGRFSAEMLNGPSRIAAFSIGGWDTHRNQEGAITRPLRSLSAAVRALQEGLGPNWRRTAVLAMTEFGRTARENGDRGTDHGTGGVVFAAGGAIKGRRVLNGPSDRGGSAFPGWPGLGRDALYLDRDLMATDDLRRLPGWALMSLFGASRTAIETVVFPGLALGGDPRLFA